MKIKNNRDILKNMKATSEQTIEQYQMQRNLLFEVRLNLIRQGNGTLERKAKYRIETLDSRIAWERGLVAGYNVALTLMH